MSSYLLFFALGEFERAHRRVGGVDVGVIARRGDLATAEQDVAPVKTVTAPLLDMIGPMPYPVVNTLLDAGGASVATLERLKELGVRLAIDDFGTGHSSLTWLRRLPADFLKVDRTFVAGLGTDPGDTAIVRAVLNLGQALGLSTVAEGVETPEQLAALRELGCDWAQGYHLARE